MTKLDTMKKSHGKKVRIIDIDGKEYNGYVRFVEDADENDMNEFAIHVWHETNSDGFYESDIKSIEIIE